MHSSNEPRVPSFTIWIEQLPLHQIEGRWRIHTIHTKCRRVGTFMASDAVVTIMVSMIYKKHKHLRQMSDTLCRTTITADTYGANGGYIRQGTATAPHPPQDNLQGSGRRA